MIIKLSDFAGYFANLPAFQSILGIEHQTMLLLEFPQLCVYIEGASKVRLPLSVAILRQISIGKKKKTYHIKNVFFKDLANLPQSIEELFGLL